MNTETPPPPLSNAEAVQILTDGRLLASLTPRQKDAVLRAVHLVSRRSAQKERNERNRRARGVYFTPPEVIANPPFAPCVPAPETNHATERALGNAAAMREALTRIVNLAPEYPARGVDWNALAAEAFLTASSALAAPARNCDILSEEAANKAWDDYRHANVLPRGGWDFRHIIAWLFAPEEGGAE